MRAVEVAFIGALVYHFPRLLPSLQDHLDHYDGVLPHLFLADVTRWLVAEFQKPGESAILEDMLEFIELGFADGGEHLRELIAVSFLENLPEADEAGGTIRERLGPALRQQITRGS